MVLATAPCFSLNVPLTLPVHTSVINGLPKIIAGSGPVTPVNVVLERRHSSLGATLDSVATYARAGYLYASFCAQLERAIIDVSDEEFSRFKEALLGSPFPNSQGEWVTLPNPRNRGARTADLMLALIYSVAADVEEMYGVSFPWRRYGRLSAELIELAQAFRANHPVTELRRAHRIKWTPRKVVGLPDDQFVLLINRARELWGDVIPDGDLAYAENPETQRGALFLRNVAILFILRYAGSRRSEVTRVTFEDVRRSESKLMLTTKGHGGEFGERLPVILFPWVDKVIWRYVTKSRPEPLVGSPLKQDIIFLSHSVRNYGQPISPQTVRKMVDKLRVCLAPPWDTALTPHMLRHSFGYDLQRYGGDAAVTAGMRHASISSSKPYSALVEVFAEHVLDQVNDEIENVLADTGLLEILRKN
jgi:integrase